MSTNCELEEALAKHGDIKGPYVIAIDTDPYHSTPHGGTWWDIAIQEANEREEVKDKFSAKEATVADGLVR